jgi:hypothetical protein
VATLNSLIKRASRTVWCPGQCLVSVSGFSVRFQDSNLRHRLLQRRVMRAAQTPHAGSVGLGTGSGYARANGHRGRCRVLKHVDDDVAVSTVGGLVQYRCRADDVVGSVTIEGVGADRIARVCGDNRCAADDDHRIAFDTPGYRRERCSSIDGGDGTNPQLSRPLPVTITSQTLRNAARPSKIITGRANLSVLQRTGVVEAAYGYASRTSVGQGQPNPEREQIQEMIVLGVILILVGYLLPVPAIIATIGWILLVIGVVLLILGQVGRPVGGRRYWY